MPQGLCTNAYEIGDSPDLRPVVQEFTANLQELGTVTLFILRLPLLK